MHVTVPWSTLITVRPSRALTLHFFLGYILDRPTNLYDELLLFLADLISACILG